MIKNIIFDIGNVILFFDYKKIVQGISKDPADIAFIVKHVINSPEWLGYGLLDLGVISAEDAVIAIQDRTEHTHDRLVEDFLLHSQEDRKVDPGIREEIIKLKQEGYKVYLLSNIPHIRYDFIRNTSDLFDIVDGMVLSCLVKKIKPHESIYKELLAKYNLDPSECVFIDDNKKNIKTAERLGIKGINVFPTPESVKSAITRIKNLNKK